MSIEVDFNQYVPSLCSMVQWNLIFLEKGYIEGIQLIQNTITKEYQIQIQRTIKVKDHASPED